MLSFRSQYFSAYVFACLRQYKAAEPKVQEVTGPHIFTSMNPLKKTFNNAPKRRQDLLLSEILHFKIVLKVGYLLGSIASLLRAIQRTARHTTAIWRGQKICENKARCVTDNIVFRSVYFCPRGRGYSGLQEAGMNEEFGLV